MPDITSDIQARADAEEGIRQGLDDVALAAPGQRVSFSKRSKQKMAYLVRIASRAERDLAMLYQDINDEKARACIEQEFKLAQASGGSFGDGASSNEPLAGPAQS